MHNRPILELEFKEFIQDQLVKSCGLMFDIAKENCHGGYVDNDNCDWYHSAWPYLRILDKVSSPTWHFDFYYEQFISVLKNNSNVLISGTADYTLLALIFFAAKKNNITPNIWVCDICNTPLLACKYFADFNSFKLNTFKGDIKSINISESFDIITTDAFLTRFNYIEKTAILSKWAQLLTPNGKVVTTVRIEDLNKQDEKIKTNNYLQQYTNDISILLVNSILKNKEEMIKKLAREYISKIISMPFSNINEVEDILLKSGLAIQYSDVAFVKGEVKPTKYLRLTACKIKEG